MMRAEIIIVGPNVRHKYILNVIVNRGEMASNNLQNSDDGSTSIVTGE